MFRLLIALALSVFGGTALLHYLKNFLLKERVGFYFDWDGMVERLLLTYILAAARELWLFIPLVIALKALFRLVLLGFDQGVARRDEPGAAPQKVLLKSELACDLFLSPAWAIILGVWLG